MALNTITNNIQTNPIRYSFLTVAALTAIVLGILGLMSVQPFHQMGNIGSISLIAASLVVYIALLACPNKNKVSEMQMLEEKLISKEPIPEDEPASSTSQPHEFVEIVTWDFIKDTLGVRYLDISSTSLYASKYDFKHGDYIVYQSASETGYLEYHTARLYTGKGTKPVWGTQRLIYDKTANKMVAKKTEIRQQARPSG